MRRGPKGNRLVVAQESAWATVKRLQARCHEAGIPAVLEGCGKDG